MKNWKTGKEEFFVKSQPPTTPLEVPPSNSKFSTLHDFLDSGAVLVQYESAVNLHD